jgi:hypothetical protein
MRMELPIRIVISLFVAVIVAVALIGFASKSIDDSRQKLKKYYDEDLEEDKIIQVPSVTSKGLL